MNIMVISQNKKALFNYKHDVYLECGIILVGSEVKAIKTKKAFSLDGSYVSISKDKKVIMHNSHVPNYDVNSPHDHVNVRPRELLINKHERLKVSNFLKQHGHTCIPMKVYLKQGLIKVSISLCSGKKQIDKKKEEKINTIIRNIRRETKWAETISNRK